MAIPCAHNAKQASATRSMLHRKVRPPLMRLALLVFAACVLAASGSSSWINFRVYNEDPSSGTLSLQLNGQPVSSIALHSCNEEIITVEFNPSAIGTVTLNSVTGNAVIFSWTPHAYNFGHEYTLVALPGSVQQLIDVNTVKHNDGIDVARLRILNTIGEGTNVSVAGITENCYKCRQPSLCDFGFGGVSGLDGSCWTSIGVGVDTGLGYLTLDARHYFNLNVTDTETGAVLFASTLTLEEHSTQTLILRTLNNGSIDAQLVVDFGGNDRYIPLYIALGTTFAVAVGYTITSCFYNSKGDSDTASEVAEDAPAIQVPKDDNNTASLKPKSSNRIVSVDTFRGIALSIMIFVNYGGGGYWFLDHSKWNGLTVADLVFPWFMWMMGVSLAMSLSGQKKQGIAQQYMSWKIIVRSIKLFLLGMFLNNGQDLGNWRVLGVLQYFGVACLINGLMEIWFPVFDNGCGCKRQRAFRRPKSRYEEPLLTGSPLGIMGGDSDLNLKAERSPPLLQTIFSEIWPYRVHFLFMSALVGTYLALQYLLPVPGCPTGYIGPGGLAMPVGQEHCTGGAHRYIDLKIFGVRHFYHGITGHNVPISAATCADTYDCAIYDPEGTLGMLTAALMTFLGVQAGRIIVVYKATPSAMIKRWVVWGVVLGSIGTALCGASKNDGIMPLNKNLWSPSFIAIMSGTGFLALTLTYLLVDKWKLWSGAPFKYTGMNSIIVYAGSELLQGNFPFSFQDHNSSDNFKGGQSMTHAGALGSNILGVCCWYTIAYLMYRANFFYNL